MSKFVRKTVEDCKPTAVRKHELKKLAARPDSEIDLSDIPELTESSWQNAIRNPILLSLGNAKLTDEEAKAWRSDLEIARRTLKAPVDKWI